MGGRHTAYEHGSDSEDEDVSLLWGHQKAEREKVRTAKRRRHVVQRRKHLICGVLAGTMGFVALSAALFFMIPNEWRRLPFHKPMASEATTKPAPAIRGAISMLSLDPETVLTPAMPNQEAKAGAEGKAAEAVLAAQASPAAAAMAPLKTVTNISKSQSDDREYRALTLSNTLRVMLVSDSEADVAAASVDVNVGSSSDPEELPGLAHFNEHMLFLSSAKFPREDEFMGYLSQHGGSSNAYTAGTHTNFYFQVAAGQLQGALERFAQFFISPRFDPDQVGREVHAVDSEHSKNLQSDSWRRNQLLKSLSSEKHPYHKFGTGSVATLLKDPALRDELVKWYKAHYSSSIMTLTIVGKESLDDLATWATTYFSDVPNIGIKAPDFSSLPRPFNNSNLPTAYLVNPVRQLELLSVTWQLPSVQPHRRLKPLRFLSYLLGGEYNGSLTSLLIGSGLAESVSAGASEDEADYSLFEVSVALTPAGLAKWETVLTHIYGAIKVARGGVTRDTFEQLRAQDELAFRFKEKEEPSDYASDTSSNLQLYGFREAFEGPSIMSEFDADVVTGLLDQLTPRSMITLLTSHTLAANLSTDEARKPQFEKWYGTPYAALDLSASLLDACDLALPDASLLLPRRNPFIPTNFSLVAPPPNATDRAAERKTLQRLKSKVHAAAGHSFTASASPAGGEKGAASSKGEKKKDGKGKGNGKKKSKGLKQAPSPVPSSGSKDEDKVAAKVVRGSMSLLAAEHPAERELLVMPNPRTSINMAASDDDMAITLSDMDSGFLPPRMIFQDTRSRLWHRVDVRFGLPMASVHLEWALPSVSDIRGAASAQLLQAMVTEQMRALAFEAGGAGIEFAVGATSRGWELRAFGFSQRVADVASEALIQLRKLERHELRFKVQKERILRELADMAKDMPHQLASSYQSHLLRKLHFMPSELSDTLSAISLDDLEDFSSTLFNRSFAEALILGNVAPSDALDVLDDLQRKVPGEPLETSLRPQQAVADLMGSSILHASRHPNKEEPNSAVRMLLQLGRLKPKQAACVELLGDMLSQPFFHELRTVQQLGYIVGAGASSSQGVYHLGFVVQSAVVGPPEITRRIEAFLRDAPALIANISADGFADYVVAAQERLLEPPKRLSSVADDEWGFIADRSYRFSWPRRVASALASVKLQDVRSMLVDALATAPADTASGAKGGRMLVQVYSNNATMASPPETAEGYTLVSDLDAYRKEMKFWPPLANEAQGRMLNMQ